jgi:peptidase E
MCALVAIFGLTIARDRAIIAPCIAETSSSALFWASVGRGTRRARRKPPLRILGFGWRSGRTRHAKILIAGGAYGTTWLKYMAELTGKPRPKLLYLPHASADSVNSILGWYRSCAPLNVEPLVQEAFIASTRQSRGWDEVLLSVDGIVCSGGNTLNQQAIWKAQGIDVVLRQAWDRGIVLGGASAGSLCWFEEGTTDSRPKELSTVQCLGFLKGSHSPHYDAEPGRRPLYQKLIASGQMKPGYACDNNAGIYFEDNTVKRVVATNATSKVYYVSMVNGKINERVMEPEIIS